MKELIKNIVPTKYNGNLLDESEKKSKKYGLFLDFLKINYKGFPNFDYVTGLKVDKQPYGTKTFKNLYKLSYRGHEFGVLENEPRSAIIDKTLNQFKLSNHLFYTLPAESIQNLLEEFTKSVGLTYYSLNRVDIALDFEGAKHDVHGLVKGFHNNELLISGRQKKVDFYTHTIKGKIETTGVKIGSRTTSRFLRIYNKTLESKSNIKTDITDAWQKFGLKGEIWRYEYQLNSAFLRDLEAVDLNTIFSDNGLYNLLKKANSNHFDIKYNTGKKETNKEASFELFSWRSVRACLNVIFDEVKRIKRNIKETFIGQQRMIKGLLRSYFSTGQRLEYIVPLKIMLDDFQLWEWFGKKLPFYLDEFVKAQYIKTFDRKLFINDMNFELCELESQI